MAGVIEALDEESPLHRLTRENGRLLEELERLRRQHDDLVASAEMWIRLYEAALERTRVAATEYQCFPRESCD